MLRGGSVSARIPVFHCAYYGNYGRNSAGHCQAGGGSRRENRPEQSRKILQTGLALSLSLGIVFTFVALFSASWVSSVLLTDQRVYYTFVSMTPMIAIVAVSSIYRGYFQGRQNMIPSAFSSVLESVIRIFFMLWFSWMLLPKGIAFAAAGAMLGVTVGEIAGMLALLGQYYFNDKKDRSEPRLPWM